MPVGEKEEFDSFYDQCSEAAMATAAIAMGGASPAKETSCTISEITINSRSLIIDLTRNFFGGGKDRTLEI